jgi:hypothetical protein
LPAKQADGAGGTSKIASQAFGFTIILRNEIGYDVFFPPLRRSVNR